DDRRSPSRPARGMNASDAVTADGEHPEGIRAPEIVLRREREAAEIVEALAVVGVGAGLVEALAVERDLLIGVAARPAQPCELQPAKLVARGDLDRLQLAGPRSEVQHQRPSSIGSIVRSNPEGPC